MSGAGGSSPPVPRRPFVERFPAIDSRVVTRVLWIVAALVVIAHAANLTTRRMGDFTLYYQAGVRTASGETPYRLEDPHRYLYAPPLALLFAPFAVVPLIGAKLVWYALNLTLVLLVVRSVGRIAFSGRAPPGFSLLVVLVLFRFFDNVLGHGQINLVLFWWILTGYELAGRGRNAAAGALLGIAVLTKLFPAILLLGLVIRGEIRFAAWTVVAIVAWMLLPWLWWGEDYWGVLLGWVDAVRAQAGHYDVANKINQSVHAFAHRVLGEPASGGLGALAIHLAFVAGLGVASLRARSGGETQFMARNATPLAVELCYATVALPYSWKYYFVNLALAVALIASRLWTRGPGGAGRILFVVFLLTALPGSRIFGKDFGVDLLLASLHFGAAVVLFVTLVFPALRRGAPVGSEGPG